MNLLLVGSGGREHALAWCLAKSPRVSRVFVAPGNPGMAREEKVVCTGISAADFAAIHAHCVAEKVGFVVVGPDQALADGIVDFLTARGTPAFGPTRAAAQIEWSKAFAKEIMRTENIPTARFEAFTELSAAEEFLATVGWGDGWVVKADGLALGKGVVVAADRAEALSAVREMMAGGTHGSAGKKVVIEERLLGREVSAFSFCDGETAAFLGFACDYKRIQDGDQGPNTGGMGAFSPADWLPLGTAERVQAEIVRPLLKALKNAGAPFKGILFTGLMITERGPKVIEFNARFGDPETQALLPRLDEDLLPWLEACASGTLSALAPEGPRMRREASVHVVQAAEGYPGTPRKGDPISLAQELLPPGRDGEKLFFAGVSARGDEFLTAGGRVLGITALGGNRAEARARAYALSEKVRFAGQQRRGDVGK